MSNHNPEAIAAFPDRPHMGGTMRRQIEKERTAFDLGVASVKAQQYAVTREALIEAVEAVTASYFPASIFGSGAPESLKRVDGSDMSESVADALLVPTGPLLDAADVWDECHAAVNAHYSIAGGGPINPYRKEKNND